MERSTRQKMSAASPLRNSPHISSKKVSRSSYQFSNGKTNTKITNEGFRRVFASLSGLRLDPPRLAQSCNDCTSMARWNVCPALGKDASAVAELGANNVDAWLGVAWLYLCALRNVETPPRSDPKIRSARP